MLIKFNNNNIWEVVEREDDGYVVFYKRVLTPNVLRTAKFDEEINEEQMTAPNTYDFNDWKIFFGEGKLKGLVMDIQKEQFVLPMIYWAIFVKGLTDMVRERETKFIFHKRNHP